MTEEGKVKSFRICDATVGVLKNWKVLLELASAEPIQWDNSRKRSLV